MSNCRVTVAFAGVLFALAGLSATTPTAAQEALLAEPGRPENFAAGPPTELTLKRAGSTEVDLRSLPPTPPNRRDRPEREDPKVHRVALPGGPTDLPLASPEGAVRAPAPAPISTFLGLDFLNWGAGRPPDTVGDVGPTHYIQAVNTSLGIYRKSDNAQLAAFTFDTFMSLGNFGNLCDTDNFGDPVILYDTFEDRWVITDFAFQVDGSGNVVNPPGAFQCFAVSKNGDPVSGGWNYYSIQITDALNDYPKFGIWPDGIYMSANMFAFPASGAFQGTRVWAFNKAQMYAGNATVQIVQFSPPGGEFTLLPANARLQTGTPPLGSPNYFSVIWQFTNAISVYKFHVDWNSISTSTFTGPSIAIAPASWSNAPATVPAMGGNNNDTLAPRLMMQNQYTNIGGVESLWNTHTVLGGAASTAAPRWYQLTVTGGTVAATTSQAATHAPDTTIQRYMPSLAVDRAGNMAIGYSASGTALMPALRYAGRLAGDTASTLPQTETSLVEGTGAQNTGNRWGDYSAMSLDPDGCTFWYTGEYYLTTGNNWQTRVGSFKFPSCTTIGSGTLEGTVTATPGGAPISGASVGFGSRTTTTNGSGFYQFTSIPAGTYPSLTVSAAGFDPGATSAIPVSDSGTTVRDFALTTAATSGCITDSSQAQFQTGVPSNVDLTASAGDVILLNAASIDQQNTTLGTSGVGITITTWGGQTFTPAVTGQMTQVDINLFCSGCTGTTPNLTLSLRATSAGLPTGADLASTTITGFSSGSSGYYVGTFASPPTLNAGTQYALVIRPTANPSPGTYALTRSGTATLGSSVYAGGTRVAGATSGTVWSIPLTGGVSTDSGFKVYMKTGFAAAGNQVSSLKDSNPAAGLIPTWSTLSYTASVPGSTSLQFQVAASNAAAGPFSFVGPDGTAATFFTTSGASLSQFNGQRYLKYKAYLTTSDSAVTPTVNDVTVCFAALPPPDLAISKTDGVTTADPGGTVIYTITATNPDSVLAATAATVTDTFPASLSCGWTCSGSGGATCPASGAGNINTAVTLPASSSVTFTATCTIDPGATGSLSNTATVSSTGDPNSGNNTATDTDTLTSPADLAISKTDGATTEVSGTSVTYTLVAANSGPGSANSVTVADTFPASLTGCSTTSVAAGGATGNDAGPIAGPLSDSGITLPAGASVTYTASCTLSAGATGSLANTATVSSATVDPNPANNSATDTDTLTQETDLALTKVSDTNPAPPSTVFHFNIQVTNNGPSDSSGFTVTDTLPPATAAFFQSASGSGWSCGAPVALVLTCTHGSLAVGAATATLAVTMQVAASPSPLTFSNTASVATAQSDPVSANNSATAQVATDLTPPTLTNLTSVEDTGDGLLAACETVRARVGQLLLRFSEGLQLGSGGADDPASYLLVQAGANATLDTTSCAGGVQGDDLKIRVNSASYAANSPSAPSSTVTLALNDQNRLHFGIFRLLACDSLKDAAGNQLDGDGAGGAGGDFRRDFRVDAFDLFANAHFDCDSTSWQLQDALYTALADYQASPRSGATRASQNAAFANQCVALGALTSARERAPYDLEARLRLDPLANTSVSWSLSCVFFSGANCTGSASAAVGAVGNVSSPTLVWLYPKHRYVTLPVGAVSARCGFDFGSLTAFTADLDGLNFRGNGVLFEDGFESGTTGGWH